jgi:thiosulfate dehydrogenase (quinone) large subunit
MTTLEHRPATATPTITVPTPAPWTAPIPTTPAIVPATTRFPVVTRAARYVLAGLRLALGWIFLWAFLDKLFGLGHETTEKAAWINGGQPTKGFLANATAGPFADIYRDLAGATWADWLFMLGLAGVGVALISGIGLRIAAAAGGLLMVLMWTAVLPPENNLFLDDHLIYAGLLAVLALLNTGDTIGLGRFWGRTALVRALPWLK